MGHPDVGSTFRREEELTLVCGGFFMVCLPCCLKVNKNLHVRRGLVRDIN